MNLFKTLCYRLGQKVLVDSESFDRSLPHKAISQLKALRNYAEHHQDEAAVTCVDNAWMDTLKKVEQSLKELGPKYSGMWFRAVLGREDEGKWALLCEEICSAIELLQIFYAQKAFVVSMPLIETFNARLEVLKPMFLELCATGNSDRLKEAREIFNLNEQLPLKEKREALWEEISLEIKEAEVLAGQGLRVA